MLLKVEIRTRAWSVRAEEEEIMPTTMIQDPVNAKEFFENKLAFTTGPVDLERMRKEGSGNIVDVRAAEDYAQGHIPGAVNLPKDRWASLQGLRKDRTNVSTVIHWCVIWRQRPPCNLPGRASRLWNWTEAGAGGRRTGLTSKPDRRHPTSGRVGLPHFRFSVARH